jgi:hypothetical protein
VTWLAFSVLREGRRPRQFALSSLFFLTTFVAIYLAVVRWLVVHSRPSLMAQWGDIEKFLAMGGLCLLLWAIAGVFLLAMAESVVWFGVWLVRRPWVRRRWLRRPDRAKQR